MDQPVLFTSLMNQIWLLAQWWTGNTGGYPEPYHTDKGKTCFQSTFSDCLQLKVSTILWINQSYWKFQHIKLDPWYSNEMGSTDGECWPYNTYKGLIWWFKIINETLSLQEMWYHKSSHVVETRGTLEKLSANAHDS